MHEHVLSENLTPCKFRQGLVPLIVNNFVESTDR